MLRMLMSAMGRWAGRLLGRDLARIGPDIPEALWQQLLEEHDFIARRNPQDLKLLRRRCSEFLACKEFHGAHGFKVTDQVALSVAAQACLPVLHLGLSWYDGFVGIVMHEGPVRARREVADEHGLVHIWDEELVGEALEGGPVMLSWHSGAQAEDGRSDAPAFNVVIHEFAHVMDLRDGGFDGTPPMPAAARAEWQRTMAEAFDRFDERSACGYESVIDDYGAQDIGEFFAVTAEAFFTRATRFAQEQPELHALYTGFFRQNPAADPASGGGGLGL